MTPDQVRSRLEEAMRTLRLLRVVGTRPSGYKVNWPDMLTGYWEMWNDLTQAERREREKDLNRTRIHPTPDQISRMDEVLPNWLKSLEPLDRKLVMAVAGKVSLRKTGRKIGRSHEYIRYRYGQCLERIAKDLTKALLVA